MGGERRFWALRGATAVRDDEPDQIRAAVGELVADLERRNALDRGWIVSAYFTMTADLHSEFPTRAARLAGWSDVPMLSGIETPVVGAFARCIRVLLHVEFPVPRQGVLHSYLRGTEVLRSDAEPP